MDIIAAENNVDRRMHFDPGDFGAAQFHHVIDMMNMVVFNNRKHAAHTPNNAALFAVVDVSPADNVAADFSFSHP